MGTLLVCCFKLWVKKLTIRPQLLTNVYENMGSFFDFSGLLSFFSAIIFIGLVDVRMIDNILLAMLPTINGGYVKTVGIFGTT